MSSYKILPYSQEKAKKLGVKIRPSTNPKKKIDVFRGEKKVASIGATGFTDYPHLLLESRSEAEKRRKAYRARHAKNRSKIGTPGFWASEILW